METNHTDPKQHLKNNKKIGPLENRPVWTCAEKTKESVLLLHCCGEDAQD